MPRQVPAPASADPNPDLCAPPTEPGRAGDDTTLRLGIALRCLRAAPTRERFDDACDAALELLRGHEPRGLLGWTRERRNAGIAAGTLRWWLYAACPSCRARSGAPRALRGFPECTNCHGTGRRPMERALAGTPAARWLADQLDRAADGTEDEMLQPCEPGRAS